MLTLIREFLIGLVGGGHSAFIVNGILLVGTAAVSVGCYYLTRWILVVVERLVLRTPTDWDDHLITPGLLRAVSQLAPALVVRWMLPGFFGDTPATFNFLSDITSLYILTTIVWAVAILINNLYNAFLLRPVLRPYAVKGVFQMVKLVVIGVGVIIGMSIIIGKQPGAILTALGASAAVLMLVFRDTILGLVASVQLTANKMLNRGDWIVAEKHGANGEVVDVSLTTVKVRNWDNSVTTIPPYSLVSESFKNFQPMKDSGGRRVDRSIYIDVNTVRFCTPDELRELADRGWLDGIDTDEAGRTVNLGLLRRYLEHYLATHPRLNHDMLHMVRQLEPTPSGLPVQLYFFTATTEWVEYETIQSDVFDHVYAAVRLFGLRIFQTPAGADIESLTTR